MNDLIKAKELLKEGYTCVFCKGKDITTTTERGVLPLVKWIDEGKCFKGYSAADKVVGKAAALLYVILGAQKIYTSVISKKATDVFEKYGIEYWYDTLADAIINRKGDGFCPMETAVGNIETPDEALTAIKNKLKEM
ncbi:MAG: DUF1893 domain-containing protein [Clostridia bacterium]|nr:DUF1893 domain-containing protein [Clostridia bacterium]